MGCVEFVERMGEPRSVKEVTAVRQFFVQRLERVKVDKQEENWEREFQD